MIKAIKYAREEKIPYLGLCYGMQLAVVEFSRNVAGLTDANTTEANPKTPNPVIHMIPRLEELTARRAYGGTMRLGRWDCKVKSKTISFDSYLKYGGFIDKEKMVVSERHRHRYEFNNKYASLLEKKGLVIAGRSVLEDLVEIIELPTSVHPFFVATQFHPEYKSRPLSPHPIFLSFIQACLSLSSSGLTRGSIK